MEFRNFFKRLFNSEKSFSTFDEMDKQERKLEMYGSIEQSLTTFKYADIQQSIEDALNKYSFYKKRELCKSLANKIIHQLYASVEPMHYSGLINKLSEKEIKEYAYENIKFLLEGGFRYLDKLEKN